MSLVFFLFITTLFLFFFANFILSSEKNPFFAELMGTKDTRERDLHVEIVGGLCNAAGIVLAVGLVAAVPFFRALAVVAMAGLVGHFFYRKHFGTVKGTPERELSPIGLHGGIDDETQEAMERELADDDLSALAQIDADRDHDQRVDDSGPITHP